MSSRLPIYALGGVVVIASVLAFAWRKHSEPVAAAPVVASSAPKPLVDTPQHCEEVKKQYQKELAKLQSCATDDDCVAERRAGVHSALDGCARFYRRGADLRAADQIAESWSARGCSNAFLQCREPKAQCFGGSCLELPPASAPRSWKRITHRNVFSFFIPSEARQKDVMGEDSEVGEWEMPLYRVKFDYGYGANIEGSPEEGDTVLRRETISVGEAKGVLLTARFASGTYTTGVQVGKLVSHYGAETNLTLWVDCKREADCADGAIIARSLEIH